ncbi:hypothetical protein QFZ96_002178 [Paraburkholderia youngii]
MSDISEESGGGRDDDSRDAGQNRPKRVCVHQAFNFAGNLLAFLAQGRELLGKTRHDDGCCLSSRLDHSLFAECLDDFDRQALVHVRCEFGEAVGDCFLADWGEFGG